MNAMSKGCGTERYARCVETSKRVRWDIEEDIIRGRRFDAAHKASEGAAGGHARIALDFIGELYRIERALWDRERPVTAEHRLRVAASA